MSKKRVDKLRFIVGGKPTVFSVEHDLPDTLEHYSLDDAFQSWIARANEHTPENFVEYVNSKTAMTGNTARLVKD